MAKTKTDKAFLEYLKRHAPHLLEANADFDEVVTRILRSKDAQAVVRNRRKRKPSPRKPSP